MIDLYGLKGENVGMTGGQIPADAVGREINPGGSIFTSQLAVASKTWVSNVVWNNSVEQELSWNDHQLVLQNGTTVNIASGSFGVTTNSKYYIYYKVGSPTYTITANSSEAMGSDRFTVATVEKSETSNKVAVYTVNTDGSLISGDRVTTGRIQSVGGQTYFDLDNEKIVMNDDTNNRVYIDGTAGVMKVSKEGFDADTAKNADLTFSSDFIPFANEWVNMKDMLPYVDSVQSVTYKVYRIKFNDISFLQSIFAPSDRIRLAAEGDPYKYFIVLSVGSLYIDIHGPDAITAGYTLDYFDFSKIPTADGFPVMMQKIYSIGDFRAPTSSIASMNDVSFIEYSCLSGLVSAVGTVDITLGATDSVIESNLPFFVSNVYAAQFNYGMTYFDLTANTVHRGLTNDINSNGETQFITDQATDFTGGHRYWITFRYQYYLLND